MNIEHLSLDVSFILEKSFFGKKCQLFIKNLSINSLKNIDYTWKKIKQINFVLLRSKVSQRRIRANRRIQRNETASIKISRRNVKPKMKSRCVGSWSSGYSWWSMVSGVSELTVILRDRAGIPFSPLMTGF